MGLFKVAYTKSLARSRRWPIENGPSRRPDNVNNWRFVTTPHALPHYTDVGANALHVGYHQRKVRTAGEASEAPSRQFQRYITTEERPSLPMSPLDHERLWLVSLGTDHLPHSLKHGRSRSPHQPAIRPRPIRILERVAPDSVPDGENCWRGEGNLNNREERCSLV